MQESDFMKLFFDIDDVLFPSTEFSALARKNALGAMLEHGLNCTEIKLEGMLNKVIKQFGSNYPKHFDALLEKLKVAKIAQPKFLAAAVGAYHDTKTFIHPYPDVPLVLHKLKEKYPLYIASNGIAIKQWDKLIRMKLAMFFQDVFVSDELGMQKSPEFYKEIAARVNAKPNECIMIGDREDKDIVPAKKVGWLTIRIRRNGAKYSTGKTVAHAQIHSLVQIEKSFKNL